jgi:hypothetical protein
VAGSCSPSWIRGVRRSVDVNQESEMDELRTLMDEQMQVRGFAPNTRKTYLLLPNIVHGDRGLKPRTI